MRAILKEQYGLPGKQVFNPRLINIELIFVSDAILEFIVNT
jgi:hypothetical protein